ncbi:Hypothetical predicted protein [Mytilus galloprovincialis]|uniref:Uncharacterized protein n=2 Tax=Mytilus galloprovincialis TaxID=29158 RepID=A0A8B6CJC2_MYTGA|nr:Hypothetical predicted protein [Mytilus galloprovincialis]
MSTSVWYICGVLCALVISLTLSFEIDDTVLSDDEYYPQYKAVDTVSDDSRKENVLAKILKYLDTKNAQRSALQDSYVQKIFENDMDSGARLPIISKRKVFWQPLGYIPASVRISGNSGKSQSDDNTGGQLFRYG